MHHAQVGLEHELGTDFDEAAEVDAALSSLAARGRAHELELAGWLLRADALALHRRFGFASLAEYADRRLGLGPRELREKLRVARALSTLPRTTEALRRGEQSWSAVRELTRVATPETETAWLEAARGATVRRLERKVARHRLGDSPDTARSAAHLARRLVFEVAPEDLAVVRAAMDTVWASVRGGASSTSPGALLVAMAEAVLGRREVKAPAYQASVTICAGCARTWQRSGGELVEVSEAVGGCAGCDAEVVGFAEVPAEEDAEATHVGHAVEGEHGEGCCRRGLGPDVPSRGVDATHVGRSAEVDAGWCRSAPGPDVAPRGVEATHVGHAQPSLETGCRRGGGSGTAPAQAAARRATHVGRAPEAFEHPSGARSGRRRSPSSGTDPRAATHVGHEAAAIEHLRHLAASGGARPLLRVMTRALGVPLRSVTPQLRRLVFARDGGRCVVPGCGHWRFIDVHHRVPRSRGGMDRLENLVCLCTGHHRALHDGVLALEGSATEGWVVRFAGGELRSRPEPTSRSAAP
jgi:hypothetical protein